MGKEGSGGGWLLKGLGCMALLAILCCCGGFISLRFFPEMLLAYFLSDAPLPGPTTEPKPVVGALERAGVCAMLAVTGEAKMEPDAVARLVLGEGKPDLTVLRVGASGDEGSLELSVATDNAPPRYFNLQLQGAFAIQQGWFTDMRLSRVIVSEHDWSSFVAGQQLTQQANQSLANERAKDANFAMLLDSIDHLRVEDGAYVLGLKRDGLAMQQLCGQ